MLKNGWISGQQGSDIWYILIGTASIVCGAVSMQLSHVRLSVPSGHCMPLLQFAAVGPADRTYPIDYCSSRG